MVTFRWADRVRVSALLVRGLRQRFHPQGGGGTPLGVWSRLDGVR